MGKRNKQATSVLNTLDLQDNSLPLAVDNLPVGMREDPTNYLSSNFGTEREPRRGGCYQGDGSAYISISGLLTTDVITSYEGSATPTCTTDGRLDISSGDLVYGITISGNIEAFYKCNENSGDICYDSSGNGNHGTIVNAITVPPEEDPNSIHQYQ